MRAIRGAEGDASRAFAVQVAHARPLFSRAEELANSVTHGLALVASLAALPVLVVLAARRGDPWGIVGASVYGAALISLYGASTVYHALPAGRAKALWRRLDHAAIYLLIAGTYTPFMLGAMRGAWGWSLFGVVWGIAVFGVLAKIVFGARLPILSTIGYLVLGWLVVIAAVPLVRAVGWAGVAWLVAGGIAYSIGTVIYALDRRIRFGHAVWHLFVMGASVCHGVAVALYARGVAH